MRCRNGGLNVGASDALAARANPATVIGLVSILAWNSHKPHKASPDHFIREAIAVRVHFGLSRVRTNEIVAYEDLKTVLSLISVQRWKIPQLIYFTDLKDDIRSSCYR